MRTCGRSMRATTSARGIQPSVPSTARWVERVRAMLTSASPHPLRRELACAAQRPARSHTSSAAGHLGMQYARDQMRAWQPSQRLGHHPRVRSSAPVPRERHPGRHRVSKQRSRSSHSQKLMLRLRHDLRSCGRSMHATISARGGQPSVPSTARWVERVRPTLTLTAAGPAEENLGLLLSALPDVQKQA